MMNSAFKEVVIDAIINKECTMRMSLPDQLGYKWLKYLCRSHMNFHYLGSGNEYEENKVD